MTGAAITLDQQIACVRRELALRKNVYRGFVARGKMKQADADKELAAMQAVHDTLLTGLSAPPRSGEAMVDLIIEFLERCGDADVEAGMGCILGLSPPETVAQFRAGLLAAIAPSGAKP